MPLKMKLGVMTPDEWLQNTVGQANKNKGNNKGGSSSSSKKPSSGSSNSKNNGVFTGNFYQDYQTRKNTQKKQNSYGAKLGKAVYDTQAKKLQDKISSSTDSNARKRYQQQLEELRSRADATLPGGLAGMEENERRTQATESRREAREREERQTRISELQEKLNRTTDRRARAAYRQELRDLQYPLSASDQRLGYFSRDIIQDAKEQYDEGTQLIREGFEEEGRQLQEQAHLMAEYQRALGGYSGGGSGADRILPELTAQENQIMTAEGKQALRAAKRLYELGEETGNEELKETGRILGQNVRLTQNSYDLDKIRELRSKEPTVKRTDAHGRPIYTPTELEAEGQRNFFPAIWNQITGSFLSLGEAAHAATREAISNRNNVAYQSQKDQVDRLERQVRTTQDEEERQRLEAALEEARAAAERLRAKEEVHPWSEGQWRLRQAAQQQETVQNSIDSPFGRLVNQAAMSALGMAPALGLSAVAGPAAGAALMGAQAAGGKAGELLSRGTSATEALGRGLVSGAIEGVTEKIPIGNLLRIARGSGGASWLRNMARQAGIEATEESASYALNYAADVAARDPEAEFSLQDLLEGAAVGALTGGVLGGGASALSGGTTASRGRTRGGTAAAQDAARRAVQEVTRETQAQMPSTPENPLLQTIQETRREREQAARVEPEEPRGPQSVLNQAVEQAAAERNTSREAETVPVPEAPQALAEREARYQQRYQDYMQRAQAAAEDPSLQTPENYQALRSELDEIQTEYNGILQARRVEAGEVSADYNTPGNHIDNRTTEDVKNRSVKAFQFDHPQLHSYYVQAAQALMEDANWSLESQSNQKGRGTVARYSEALERAADLGLSRQEIIQVCQDIIADRGQENYAAAKKVELILDQMLSEGYTPNEALGNPDQRVGPNEAYLQAKEAIPGAVTRDSFEHYLRQNALAMDAGEVTEEQLRQEWEARRTNEESDGMSFWTGARQGSSGDITSPSANRVQENERTVNNNVLQKVAEHQDEISAHGTVSELTGNEFSDVHTRKEIENAVTEFYQEIGAVDRPGFGTVRLGRRGVKDSLAHGYGQKKIAAFASVPDVIQDGVQIDYQPNWKGRDYDTYIIAGDVTIGGEPNTVGVVLIRRKNDSRFYLHEVTTTKNGDATSFQTGATEETSARLPGDVTSPIDIIQDQGATVNPELPEEQARYSVGAAPSGFDPYSRMLNEYGAIAPGEKPARMVDVPRSSDGQDRVRQSARTFMEAEATPDALVDLFQQGVVNKEWSYNPKKDKASVDRAMGILRQRDGFQNGLNQWNEMVSTGRQATKDDVVMAQMIYKAAANAGDYETAGRLAGEIAALGTISGQNIQALRLLKRATPEGKLFYIQKGVDQVNDTMEKKYGESFQGIEVPDELYQQYMNAETNEAQIAALDAIYDYVAERVPRTFGDALDTWRYFAMLGNPRTHIRNVLGNVIMQGPIQARNALSAGLQNALLPQEQRTRSVGANRATRDFARQDFEANKDVLRGNPYTTPEGGEIIRRVREKGLTVDKGKQERSAFWRGVNTMLKPLQGAASANSNLMDFEDMVFKKSTYINSLSNFLKARGYDPSTQDIPENVLEEGRGQAIEDALESTFQNYSSLASKLAELESSSRAAKLVIGGLMPFKKTPINITKRSIEFSPIGLFRGMHQWLSKVPKGEATAAEALDNIAAGITGSGIVAIGAFLASQGLINAGDDEDDRLRDFGVAQGSQEYSLNVGDYSYTIDWAAPSVIPLFLGVEGYNAFKRLLDEQENEDSPGFFTETVNAISRMFEPMMNMTMLSGLSGAIQSAAYNQANPIIGIGSNVAQNFLGQVFPTLSGQIARTIDDTRRTTFYDKTTDVPKGLQTFLQTQMNKIPGLSQRNPAWLDSWGRADVTENPLVRFLENFLSPGYIAERNTDDVDTELQRLYDLGEEGVLPKNPEKSAEVDGKRLTAEQWQTYAQTKGSESRDMLEGIISSPQYQELSDQDKAKVVRKVFEYGTYSGKEAIGADTSKFDSWYGKLIEGRDQHGISPVDYLTMYIGKSNIDNDESKSNQQQGMDVAAMIDSNDRLNDDQKKYLKENLKVYNFNPVNIGDDSKYQQAINAGFSPEEAAEGYKIIEGAKAYGEDGELDESEFERYMREKMSIEPGTEEYNKYLKAYGNRNWKSVKALIGDTTSSGHKGYTMNDQRYSSAVNAGFDEEVAKELSIGRQVADQEFGNGNGTLSKNELVNYIQSNYSQNQWRTVYSVLANSNWKNPFG